MNYHKIGVLGGTGFVGRSLVARLNAVGKRVYVLTRHRERHRELLVLPNVKVIEADIHDIHQLKQQLTGMDAVINLVGILNEKGHDGSGFQAAHVTLTRNLLEACQSVGVPRLLQMSALKADAANAPSFYLRSKGEAENHVHTFCGAVKVTSFRPSVIFGEDDGFFNRFASLLKLMPWFFPLACANARFAPVYVGDVVTAMVNALDDREAVGQRFNLCGPRIYTLKEIVEYAAQCSGLKTRIIPLPDVIAQFQAMLMDYFVPGKPFSLDNYKSLQVDSVCDDKTKQPTAVESIVPHYLGERKLMDGHGYEQYRANARRS